MYPSRPAPSPPQGASLPPNHPFATYYIPPHHSGPSVSSFGALSAPTDASVEAPAAHFQRSRTLTVSPEQPARIVTPPSLNRASKFVPVDLVIFDRKPRQTLLSDIEFIAGKRLTFPFIDKLIKSKADHRQTEADKDRQVSEARISEWEDERVRSEYGSHGLGKRRDVTCERWL